MWGRKSRESPKSDAQERLRYIQNRCEEIRRDLDSGKMSPQQAIGDLVYLIGYTTRILEQHLKTGEQ